MSCPISLPSLTQATPLMSKHTSYEFQDCPARPQSTHLPQASEILASLAFFWHPEKVDLPSPFPFPFYPFPSSLFPFENTIRKGDLLHSDQGDLLSACRTISSSSRSPRTPVGKPVAVRGPSSLLPNLGHPFSHLPMMDNSPSKTSGDIPLSCLLCHLSQL